MPFSAEETKGFIRYPRIPEKSIYFETQNYKSALKEILKTEKLAVEKRLIEAGSSFFGDKQSDSASLLDPKMQKTLKDLKENEKYYALILKKHLDDQPDQSVAVTAKHPVDKVGKFREKLLEKYGSAENAFESIAHSSENITMKDWLHSLGGLCPLGDARMLFDYMDTDHSDSVSLLEFVRVIDGMAPIKTLADFRRRMVMTQGSTRSAFRLMYEGVKRGCFLGSPITSELDLRKFSADVATSGGVSHIAESTNIFHRLTKPYQKSHVNLMDVVTEISRLSPNLIVEHIRELLLNKFDHCTRKVVNFICKGSKKLSTRSLSHFSKTPTSLAIDEENPTVSKLEVIENLVSKINGISLFTRSEAAFFFEILDFDQIGAISRKRVQTALKLTDTSSRSLDTIRQQVIDNYDIIRKSIENLENSVQSALKDLGATLPSNTIELGASEFGSMVSRTSNGQSEFETSRLAGLMGDVVSSRDFMHYLMIFAPFLGVISLQMKLLESRKGLVLSEAVEEFLTELQESLKSQDSSDASLIEAMQGILGKDFPRDVIVAVVSIIEFTPAASGMETTYQTKLRILLNSKSDHSSESQMDKGNAVKAIFDRARLGLADVKDKIIHKKEDEIEEISIKETPSSLESNHKSMCGMEIVDIPARTIQEFMENQWKSIHEI
jgi:hypothetical protein